MKSNKLRYLLNTENNQILVKPPDLLLDSSDQDPPNYKNCTFSTVSELKSLIRNRKSARHTNNTLIQEDHEQVEKLNHWRLSSAGQPIRPSPKRFSFRRKFSVTEDPAIVQKFTFIPKARESNVSFLDRNKLKVMKNEYSQVSSKNQMIIETTKKNIQLVNNELEKLSLRSKIVKDDIEELMNKQSLMEVEYQSKLANLQQQETAILLITKNFHGQKLFKIGDMHEAFVIREKIRKEKSDLHNSHQQNKENLLLVIQSKKKEQETLLFTKSEIKKEQSLIKNSLSSIYLKILKQGIDIREEGLRWVIKALWELKEPIPLLCFPSYLDEESSQYLLSMAMLELELTEYQKRLEDIRFRMKEERKAIGMKKNNEDLLLSVRERIKQISKSVISGPVGGELILKEDNTCNSEGRNFAHELTWIKENIDRIQKVISSQSEKEAVRVTENFKNNTQEYSISHILKALFGQKSISKKSNLNV